jgi:hypothetical protein
MSHSRLQTEIADILLGDNAIMFPGPPVQEDGNWFIVRDCMVGVHSHALKNTLFESEIFGLMSDGGEFTTKYTLERPEPYDHELNSTIGAGLLRIGAEIISLSQIVYHKDYIMFTFSARYPKS